jgi:hypothetical protein
MWCAISAIHMDDDHPAWSASRFGHAANHRSSSIRHSTFPGRDFSVGACRQRLSAAGKSIERQLLQLLLLIRLLARSLARPISFGMGHVRDDTESASAADCALPEAPPTCLLPSSSRGKCAPGGSGSDGAPALSVLGVDAFVEMKPPPTTEGNAPVRSRSVETVDSVPHPASKPRPRVSIERGQTRQDPIQRRAGSQARRVRHSARAEGRSSERRRRGRQRPRPCLLPHLGPSLTSKAGQGWRHRLASRGWRGHGRRTRNFSRRRRGAWWRSRRLNR